MFLYQNLANPFLGEFEHRVSNVQKGISNETSWCPGRPVGPVVTRKSQGKSTNAQRTAYAHVCGIHAARGMRERYLVQERERGKYECKNRREQYDVASRGCRYVPTRSGNRAVWRTWLGLSIKETGAGNRALYSQHKPPMQKRIERGQER